MIKIHHVSRKTNIRKCYEKPILQTSQKINS